MTNEQINDGGPAFPVPEIYQPGGQIGYGAAGMSLREWFAGQALAGLVSIHRSDSGIKSDAVTAYRFADAMLAARKEGGN